MPVMKQSRKSGARQTIALLKWLPNYLQRFGLARGAILFARVMRLRLKASATQAPITIPGLAAPVWLRPDDLSILQQIFVKQEYDIRQCRQFDYVNTLYQSSLQAGIKPLIVDCGAHVGLSVLWWKKLFPAARLIAVEPDVENLRLLKRNVSGLADVEVLEGGIWHTAESLYIQNPAAGSTAFRLGCAPASDRQIRCFSMDSIMAAAGVDWILLAKIDIEGGEEALFSNNLGWLPRTSVVTIELHDWLFPFENRSRTVLAAFAAAAFDCVLSGENLLFFRRLAGGDQPTE